MSEHAQPSGQHVPPVGGQPPIFIPASEQDVPEEHHHSLATKVGIAVGVTVAVVGTAALLAGAAAIGYGIYRHYKKKGETLKRGDSVDLPLSNHLKVVMSWVPTKGVKSEDSDLDISTIAYNHALEQVGMCYFDQKRDMYGTIQISEDVKTGEGLDEAIAVNLEQLDDMDVKYVVFNVSSFKNVPFSKFENATVKMYDQDGTLIFRFPLDHIGHHTAGCLGRFVKDGPKEWKFQAFGIPLDGNTPNKLCRFKPWVTAEEFVPYPETMYIYLEGARELSAMDSNGKSDPWASMGLVEVKESRQDRYRPIQVRGIKRGLAEELAQFLNAAMVERGWSIDQKDQIDPSGIKYASETYCVPLRTRLMAERMLLLTGSRFAASDDDRLDISLIPIDEDDVIPASETKRTDVVKKTLHPKWKEVLEVLVPMRFFLDDHISYIEIKVADQDGWILHKQQDMGYCRVPFFESFVQAYQNRKWYHRHDYTSEDMEYEMQKGSGYVKLKVGFEKPAEDCGFRLK